MKPGLYALASFDEGPLAREDLEALGILEASVDCRRAAPGFAVCAVDDSPAQDAVSVVQTAESLSVFLGYLDEQQELAAHLGRPLETPPAELAWAAIERFGPDASAALLGEWSFLRWDVWSRELTLLGSEAFRDSLFYAIDGAAGGRGFAVASDQLALTRLSWVGRSLDPEGFALRMSRPGLRRITRRRTVWRGISSALPGVRDVFGLGRHTEIDPPAPSVSERWSGSFEEAVEALDAVGRRIVGQNMQRYERSAFLLSGGLDSTLLTALGAQTRGPGAEMFCLSSVAPQESVIPDEREFSRAVTATLGVDLDWVVPAPEVSIYMPAPGAFEVSGEPIMGPRQYLYDALFQTARAGGANAVFDGLLGELSITTKPKFGARVSWPRHLLYRWRERRTKQAAATGDWRHEAFHVLFSEKFLAGLPRDWEPIWRQGPERPRRKSAGDPIGFNPALRKMAAFSSHAGPGLRQIFPYRDQRLLRLAASLPCAFSEHAGETRALGRSMLRGRVPEFVRTRTTGRPFAPDFACRTKYQAAHALTRIPLYRVAGIGEWLNLNALEKLLRQIGQETGFHAATERRIGLYGESQAQRTCLAAEFLLML